MNRSTLEGLTSGYFAILEYPKTVLFVVFCLCILAGYHARDFTFDASSDDLVVQGDPKLQFYRKMSEQFGGDDFLVVTYANRDGNLFSDASLDEIYGIQQELEDIDGVSSVFSILDAPLLRSPPIPLEEIADGYLTLRDEKTDRELAKEELTESPLFSNYLISEDGKTTALRIDLAPETGLNDLRERRDRLRQLQYPGPGELEELERLEAAYSMERQEYLARRDALLEQVRAIRDRYEDGAVMYLGGVPMVAADMITFVKRDIALFGSTVVVLMMLLLFVFFRRVRWVLLPMLISALTILFTCGLLGYFDKSVTVISANFISLLGIICISFAIHLIVRYRELLEDDPEGDYGDMVREAMSHKFLPCLSPALTAMLAFG
ncbi:MAG: MMPL family transporter, partial [Pseudomonadales bacterium]|nr:MMPL family transporter [Pseudomonadales bacterium]